MVGLTAPSYPSVPKTHCLTQVNLFFFAAQTLRGQSERARALLGRIPARDRVSQAELLAPGHRKSATDRRATRARQRQTGAARHTGGRESRLPEHAATGGREPGAPGERVPAGCVACLQRPADGQQ